MVNSTLALAVLAALCSASVYALDTVVSSVQPPKFTPNITPKVTITCAFTKGPNSGFLTVSELQLVDARSNDAVVAKINVLDIPLKAESYGPTTANGTINGNIGGKLEVVWNKPDLNHSLAFKCVAMGVDKSGIAIKVVKLAPLDVDMTPLNPHTPAPGPLTPAPTSGSFSPGAPTVDALKKIIKAQTDTINKLTTLCSLPSLNTPAPNTPAPITSAPYTPAPITAAPYTPAPITPAPVTAAPVTVAPVTPAPPNPNHYVLQSGAFQGKIYYLSAPSPSNMTKERQLCINLGGKLAELTSQAEYDYVVNFLNSHNIKEQVYVGMGYNYFAKNFYYFSDSLGKASFVNWDVASHQPHPEGSRSCVVIMNNRFMSSTVCSGTYSRRFLCQKP